MQRQDGATGGWHAQRVVSLLRVGRTVDLLQHWSVVADATLDELVIELSLGPSATVAPVYGAEIVHQNAHPGDDGRRQVIVRLPEPILPGEAHRYALQATMALAGEISAYVHATSVPCAVLETRTKFLPAHNPGRIWRLDCVEPPAEPGRWPSTFDAWSRAGAREPEPWVEVPEDGEVALTFADLRTSRAYGLAWHSAAIPGIPVGDLAGSRSETRLP